MNRRNHSRFAAALAGPALGLVLLAAPGHAQPVGPAQGLKFTEYYTNKPTQLKSVLEFGRAQPQPNGRYLITAAKWQTFRENGEGELAAAAPECVYDSGRRLISSSGPLHMEIAEGAFSIEGEGFQYEQTNSFLVVSNQVHTVLHPELLRRQSAATRTNPPAAKAPAELAPGMDIFSDQFTYAENLGLGVYERNVRVAGTNLAGTAGKLTIELSVPERRLQTLTAEQDVMVDYEKIHASGQKAFYSASTDVIQLTDHPAWRMEQREGSADELRFERTNRVFRADGHARLKMPARSLGATGFLSGPGSTSSNILSATNQFVEILCQSYVLRTNLAVFRQDVRVSDRLGDQLQGAMTCGLMTLTFTGTNEVQKLLAEHQVVIGQQDKQFTAEQAEFTGTNGLLDLTGNPAWRAGLREGKGDLVRVKPEGEEMLVRGHAVMRLPGAELSQSSLSALSKPKKEAPRAATNEVAEVYCQEYFLTPVSALFRGGVRIEHPRMRWECPEITMLSPPGLEKTERVMIAEPGVTFDVLDDEGRNFHGTGDKAVFTHRVTSALTNDIMVLTGNPAMLAATNLVGRNKVLTLDLASHKLTAPGQYELWGTAPALAATTLPARRLRR